MARPTSRKKSQLSQAVVELRTRMGVSQQEFSNMMGVALNTIARYENSREPDGITLLRLAKIAADQRHEDLANRFRHAFQESITEAVGGKGLEFASLTMRADAPFSGLLMLPLQSLREFDYGTKFMSAVQALRAPRNDKEHEAAKRALDAMVAALSNEQIIPKGRRKK